jgi:hypothetical protein
MAENGRPEWFGTAYGPVAKSARCLGLRKRALEAIVQLAVELAREGREGRKIGTLFVIGDTDSVLARSRPLLLDPLHGHAPELLHVERADFRETVKELAQLDGGFLVADDGTFISAGRYIDVDVSAPTNFLPGLGTRHAAAASVTRETNATAVAVSSCPATGFSRARPRSASCPSWASRSQSRASRRAGLPARPRLAGRPALPKVDRNA